MGAGAGGLVGDMSAGGAEKVGDWDVRAGEEILSRVVNSRIWASMDSVRLVGRDKIRWTILFRARTSCFRLAGRVLSGSWRMDFARARRSFKEFLSGDGGGAAGLESVGARAGSDEVGDSSSGGEDSESGSEPGSSMTIFCCFLNWRVALRSSASLEAPVAYRTRSGSTWNISPGLSW